MKQTLITQHLSLLGLLDTADAATIAEAKKHFWAARRKEYRAFNRKKQKSVQVFFNPEEYKNVKECAESLHISKVAFVKEAAMHAVKTSSVVYTAKLLELRKLTFNILASFECAENHVPFSPNLFKSFQAALTDFILTTKSYDH